MALVFLCKYMWMTLYLGFTDEKLCSKFAKLMQSKYEMSMMGEMTYFLGL